MIAVEFKHVGLCGAFFLIVVAGGIAILPEFIKKNEPLCHCQYKNKNLVDHLEDKLEQKEEELLLQNKVFEKELKDLQSQIDALNKKIKEKECSVKKLEDFIKEIFDCISDPNLKKEKQI